MKRMVFRKTAGLTLAIACALSFTACEKKAVVVEELGGNDTPVSETENADGAGAESNNAESSAGEETYERWDETIEGGTNGFDSVTIGTSLKDYTGRDYKALTVEIPTFDKAFAQEVCETVFDSTDNLEVYDFDVKTKRVYEDLIEAYEDTLAVYNELSGSDSAASSYLHYMPDEYIAFNGTWAMSECYKEFDSSVIEDDINKLKTEMESAPEAIENDYSYRGYIGNVNGEEFYLYFGNRDFDEYLTSPETVQFNSRVITIMKKDISQDFHGYDLTDEDFSGTSMDGFSKDSVLYKINSICTGYSPYAERTVKDVNQKYLDEAEEFISKLGYGDYSYCETESKNMDWGNELTQGFIYQTGYNMSSPELLEPDGYILRYKLDFENAEMLRYSDVCLPIYSKSGDTLDINSYVDVMVNDSGVIGCQIYNPMKIKKLDMVSDIIDNETLKNVVRESVDDKDSWNIPYSYSITGIKNVTIEDVKLVNFPVKSTDDSNEFTYVPCYLVYKKYWDESTGNSSPFGYSSSVESPCLLVNAIDGSLINIVDEIDEYPEGCNNNNTGYFAYISSSWERFQK